MISPGKFCESCGAALQEGSRFCEKCGQPVGADGVTPMPRPAVAISNPACPACGTSDQVVAASAYKAETDPEVTGDTDRVPPDMVTSFLEQPEKPVATGILGWVIAPFVPLLLFFIYWFAPIHKGLKLFLFGWTIAFWVSTLVPSLYDMQIYPFLGMLHLLFYWVALFIGRDAHKVEYLTKRLPEYNAMLARWQHTQYCVRCQKAWLDNAPAASVDIVDVEALLKG